MATDTKVTAGKVISTIQKYSNHDNTESKFDISADVNIQKGVATIFNGGILKPRDGYNGENANFSASDGYFSFNSNGFSNSGIKEALTAVLSFIEDVYAKVESIEAE